MSLVAHCFYIYLWGMSWRPKNIIMLAKIIYNSPVVNIFLLFKYYFIRDFCIVCSSAPSSHWTAQDVSFLYANNPYPLPSCCSTSLPSFASFPHSPDSIYQNAVDLHTGSHRADSIKKPAGKILRARVP